MHGYTVAAVIMVYMIYLTILTVSLAIVHRLVRGLPNKKTKLHGLSPRANYTDRATAACRGSDCQLLRIEGATWSA
jgi:hypothetical protein